VTATAELANRVRKLEEAVRQQQDSLRVAFEQIAAMHAEIEMYRNRRPLRVVNSDELVTA
jgi:hypothetical protein